MFGSEEENKNKIEQMEEKMESLEEKIVRICDILEIEDEMEDEYESDEDESDEDESDN